MSTLPTSPLQVKLDVVDLTPQQFETLPYAIRGVTTDEMQAIFGISRGAIKVRLKKLYRKFGVANKWELFAKAAAEGLQYRKIGAGLTDIYFIEVTVHKVSK